MGRLLWFVLGGLVTAAGIGASYLLQDEDSDVLTSEEGICTDDKNGFPPLDHNKVNHDYVVE